MRAVMLVLAGCGRIGFDTAALSDVGPDAAAPACTQFGPWGTPAPIPISTANSDLAPVLHPNKLALVYDTNLGTGNRALFISVRNSIADEFTTPTELVGLQNGTDAVMQASWSRDGTKLHYHQLGANDDRMVVDYLGGTSFGAPALDDVPTDGDNDSFSADDSELFYTSYLASTALSYARREGSAWVEDLVYFQPVNTDSNDEGYPALDEVTQTLYFEEAIPAGTPAHISTATRSGPGQPFTPKGALTDFVQSGSTGDPDVSRDGTTLVFASDSGGSQADLFLSTRPCL